MVLKVAHAGWIYGVPSDPLKNAQFREAGRQRAACIEASICDPTSPAMRAFDRSVYAMAGRPVQCLLLSWALFACF